MSPSNANPNNAVGTEAVATIKTNLSSSLKLLFPFILLKIEGTAPKKSLISSFKIYETTSKDPKCKITSKSIGGSSSK